MKSLRDAKYLITVADPGKLNISSDEIAFVGRSNVGKSSVINALCGIKNLARVSQTPGRTRAINVFGISSSKWIVDLPGYGYASGPREEIAGWQAMIEGYLTERESLNTVYVIVDANVGATNLDIQMMIWLQANNIPHKVIANKCDKISAPFLREKIKEIADRLSVSVENIFAVSAKKGSGIKELQKDAEKTLGL